jgi:NAD dependent epimerase/dehydratase family enzyme
MVSGSAMGIYGDRGDDILDEHEPPGNGFLADVGQAWESSADPARQAGIRVVHPRFGMVLHRAGERSSECCHPSAWDSAGISATGSNG